MSIPNWGLAPGTAGELLLLTPMNIQAGPMWNGNPVPFQVAIPNDLGLVGQEYYLQGLLADGTRFGLLEALELSIGS